MEKNTFWEVIIRTLDKVATPLSPKVIWEKANEVGTINDFVSNGKTPWATIGAYCYWDINTNGYNSTIIKTSQRPAQFYLRKLEKNTDFVKLQEKKDIEQISKEKRNFKKLNEIDLHPIVVSYASIDTHFKANLKNNIS